MSDADRTDAPWDEALRQDAAFAATTLGVLFLHGPDDEAGAAMVRALAELDVARAAEEWPFVADDGRGRVSEALGKLARGARAELQELPAATARMREAERAEAARTSRIGDETHPAYHHAPLTALLKAYRRLFKGPGHLVAPPWGSVYTDHDCVVFGESTLALRAWMRAHDIALQLDEKVPEDHIGLMLQLVATLADQRPELLDELLRDHLLTWSHHYLGLLRAAAPAPEGADERDAIAGAFYEGLATLADVTLEGMRDARGLAVTYPRFFR